LVLVRVAAVGILVVLLAAMGAGGASADTTALSTFTKTGTDSTTGSTVTGGGAAGQTKAGDTINWVLSYMNNTNSTVRVGIKDVPSGNQTYVLGSLKAAPLGQNLNVFPGIGETSTWTVPPGTTTGSAPISAPGQTILNTPGGDGYSVEGFGANIYTVFHHSPNQVFCATLSGKTCPGWPGLSSTVSPTSGTGLGGSAGTLRSGGENGSFIDGGKLYWPVQDSQQVGGVYAVGVMCLDLTTLKSCGFTQLDTQTLGLGGSRFGSGVANQFGMISSDGIKAADGNYYFFDANGNILCFNASSGPCGVHNISNGVKGGGPDNAYMASIMTAGSAVFVTYVSSSAPANIEYLSCFDTSTQSLCSGSPNSFPINEGTAVDNGFPDTLGPVLSPTGAFLGVCDADKATCVSATGATLTNPYPGITGFGDPGIVPGFGSGAIVGARFYAGNITTGNQDCFDFSAWSGTGAVPKCTGFTGPANGQNYTTRALANVPGCMAADGNVGQITFFDAQTGGVCGNLKGTVTLDPAPYYCDGQGGHVKSWGPVTLSDVAGTGYTSATITILDKNGNVVETDTLPAGQTTLDLPNVPTTGATSSITAQVTLNGVTNGTAGSPTITLAWQGDGPQICFQTKVKPTTCQDPPTVTNGTAAVTNVGSVTDGPTGNPSGTATFDEAPDPSLCHPSDSIKKIADAQLGDQTPIKVGEKIFYSYLVTNTGDVDIKSFSVDDPSLGSHVTCPTPPPPGLAPGDSETCTADQPYVVTQADVDNGGTSDTAKVSCTDRYGDPCADAPPSSTSTPSDPTPSVAIDKNAAVTPSADQDGVKVGDSIQYSYKVTNTGNTTIATVSVDDPSIGQVNCPVPAAPGLAPGESETCTAVATHTVTQSDVDAGQVSDTATAACADTKGRDCPESDPSTATVPATPAAPATSIQKIATASTSDTAPLTLGETIQYSYLVTNTGNTTIKSISVDDPSTGSVTCPTPAAPGLAPGQALECTADAAYTVTQNDVNFGSLTDTATSSCADVKDRACAPSPPSTVTVPGDPQPRVAIDKRAAVSPAADDGKLKDGDEITYSYKVTNIGNTDLGTVSVSDPKLGPVTCPAPAAPGLAPGASLTCTADNAYTVTQADVDAGAVQDSATAGCVDVGNRNCPESDPAKVIVPTVPAAPLTSVVKTAQVIPAKDQRHAKVGDKIRYSFKVTNIGNVDLTSVSVSDSKLGPVSCPTPAAPGLAPGASITCSGSRLYTVTVKDAAAKDVANVAVSRGTDPRGQLSAVSQQAKAVVPAVGGRLRLKKRASRHVARAGQNIAYTLRVTNTSTGAIARARVCDSLPHGLIYLRSSPRAHLSTGRYCWTVRNLKPHRSRTLTITVNVAPTRGGMAVNHATATAPHVRTAHATARVRIEPAHGICGVASAAAAGTRPRAHIAC
jgi:uncharacterized repeat protein (TIGR01451 family)